MTKDYSAMDIAITLTNLYESAESGEEEILEDVAIPHESLQDFLKDVIALAERHDGAGFLELMDYDLEDASITADVNRNFREHADAIVKQAESILG